MAFDAWPEGLSTAILIDGFSGGIADDRLISEMDTGPAKMRARTTAVIGFISAAKLISEEERVILSEFIRVTLLKGTIPFTHPSPYPGEGDLIMRFKTLPTWVAQSHNQWKINFEVEILP